MSKRSRSDIFTNQFEETALTLEEARSFARIGAWYLILGVPASANAAQITKARRKLQMKHHQDKCGGETPLRCAHEMSALINRAADEMLASNPDVIRQRAETNARQEREELERRARERKIEEEEMITRYAEGVCKGSFSSKPLMPVMFHQPGLSAAIYTPHGSARQAPWAEGSLFSICGGG